jgi:hypothetical protein
LSLVCCQVKVSVTGWSLVQTSPTESGVSECDHESMTMRRPSPNGGLLRHGKKKFVKQSSSWGDNSRPVCWKKKSKSFKEQKFHYHSTRH